MADASIFFGRSGLQGDKFLLVVNVCATVGFMS